MLRCSNTFLKTTILYTKPFLNTSQNLFQTSIRNKATTKTTRDSNILNLSSGPSKKDPSSKFYPKSETTRAKKKIQLTVGTAALLILPAFTFSLGIWQCYRLQWKLNLIEELKKQLGAVAIDFPVNNIESIADLEYRRVRITGEFLHDKEFIIAPRGRFDQGHVQKDSGSLLSDNNMSSHGAHVITPFKIKNSNLVIMINRGWVSPDLVSRNRRSHCEPKGVVTIEAVIRKSETRPQFVGENIPEQGVWFYKDFYQMAKQHGTHPIYVEAVYESTIPGGPIGGQTNINVRNDHLSYLVTWFTLTAVTLGMWFARFRR